MSLIFLSLFLILSETKTEHFREGRDIERERIPRRFCTDIRQPDAVLKPRNREIMT